MIVIWKLRITIVLIKTLMISKVFFLLNSLENGVLMLKNKGNEHEYKFITQSPTTKTCPYCGFKLKKIPKRKKKCPSCGKYIFVSKGKLFTEDEKDIRDWLSSVEYLRITREMFNDSREKLCLEFGMVASVNDTAWRILNTIITHKEYYQDRGQIYWAMADILRLEGKSTKEVVSEAHRVNLLRWKETGYIKYVTWHTCNDDHVCPVCKERAGKKFSIDEVENLIPAHEGCRCGMRPVIDYSLFEEEEDI